MGASEHRNRMSRAHIRTGSGSDRVMFGKRNAPAYDDSVATAPGSDMLTTSATALGSVLDVCLIALIFNGVHWGFLSINLAH